MCHVLKERIPSSTVLRIEFRFKFCIFPVLIVDQMGTKLFQIFLGAPRPALVGRSDRKS